MSDAHRGAASGGRSPTRPTHFCDLSNHFICLRMLQYPRLMICLQIIDSMDISLSKLQETGKDREAWCAAVHGITESHDRVTERQKDGVTCRQCNDSHPLHTYLQKNIYSREFPSDTVNKNLPATAEEQV